MKTNRKRLKIAIMHDYLRTYGGGERVLEELHNIWPRAQIYTVTADYRRMGIFGNRFKKMNIKTSWAQKIYPFVKKPLLYRPLLPLILNSINLGDVDMVISSSGSNIAKGVKIPKGARHICYCHTPPRFLYGFKTETNFNNNPLLKTITNIAFKYIRDYDKRTNRFVDLFIANSVNVQRRIKKIYGRESKVVYPPCYSAQTTAAHHNGNYYLVVSRLVRYKNIDLIIRVFNQLGYKLIIVGDGTLKNRLKNIANNNIQFAGEVSDSLLHDYYRECIAFISATDDEDFGMTTIEAMSFGKPVIAYYSGGHKEAVINGKTGVFFRKLKERSLMAAIKKAENINFDYNYLQSHARRFSKNNFKRNMIKTVKLVMKQ